MYVCLLYHTYFAIPKDRKSKKRFFFTASGGKDANTLQNDYRSWRLIVVLSLQLAFLFSVWLAVFEFERILSHLSIYGYSINSQKIPVRFARGSLSMAVFFLVPYKVRVRTFRRGFRKRKVRVQKKSKTKGTSPKKIPDERYETKTKGIHPKRRFWTIFSTFTCKNRFRNKRETWIRFVNLKFFPLRGFCQGIQVRK